MKPIWILLLSTAAASAQLAVSVAPVKISGQKAVVPIALRNDFRQPIESARAGVFLLDANGKMVGQATRWAIGGNQTKTGLGVGATNVFNFVITSEKGFSETNLTAKVNFNRIVLEGGKQADPVKDVQIEKR